MLVQHFRQGSHMALINTLSVDIGQPSENKEVLSNNRAADTATDNHQFSSYMAYEQGKNQAEKRQISGNETQSNVAKAVESDTVAEEAVYVEKQPISDAEKELQTSQNRENKPLESIEIKTDTDGFHNNRAEVAIQLLDFINASEETSTDKVSIKSREFAPESDLSKQIVPMKAEQTAKEGDKNAVVTEHDIVAAENIGEVKNKTVKTSDEPEPVAAESFKTKDSSASKEQSTKSVDNTTELLDSNEDSETNSEQSSLNAASRSNTKQNAPSQSENLHKKQADPQVSVSTSISEEYSKAEQLEEVTVKAENDVKNSLFVESDKLKDKVSPIKSTNEPIVEKPAAIGNVGSNIEAESVVEAVKHASNSAAITITSDNTNRVVQDKAPEPRVINQATNTLVSSHEDVKQDANAEQESNESPAKQQHEVLVKEQVQVSSKAAFVEQMTERTSQQTSTTNPHLDTDTKLQSSHERELASIQASSSRPSHEALSTQSVKSTQAILQETISINRKDFGVAVKEKVMVAINQKLRQLDIRLDPPELGSMQVKLNLQNEQAAVNFVVQSQQAKEALEQHMGKLKDMLAQSGVDVGDTNIEQRNNQNSEQASTQGGSRQLAEGSDDEMEQAIEQVNPNLYKASSTGIDYYA